MPEPTLAVVHDPRGRLSPQEARGRVRAALESDGRVALVHSGALTVGWVGAVSTSRPQSGDPTRLIVADGIAAIGADAAPSSWTASLRASSGAFAVVAWAQDWGLVARDHLGVRPLFFWSDGSVLYAASEVRYLLELLPRRPAPDLEALALFLSRRPDPEGRTTFAGVRAVPPAHALRFNREGIRLERFWSPRPRSDVFDATPEEASSILRDEVFDAIVRHGAGAPDAAVLLSGGLDSSVVMAGAGAHAQETGRSVPTALSGVFPGHPELDERGASGAVVARWGAPWATVSVGAGHVVPDALAFLEQWQLPLPHPNSAFFRAVREEAVRRGVGVLLDGEGGDELFGCEPLLLADRVLEGDVRGALRLARRLPGTGGRLDARRARVMLRKWVLPGVLTPSVIAALRRIRRPSAPAWLSPAAHDAVRDVDRAGEAWWTAGRPRWRAHLGWVLSDGRTAMGVQDHLRRIRPAGVAAAHPFLDVRLVELVLGLPPELAFDPNLDRPLLRRAMRGLLPDSVRLRRDKVGFNRLLLEALTRADRGAIDRTLGDGALELGAVANADLIRAMWREGPHRHPHGPWIWSATVWRAYAAETWLRREAGAAA